jgi:hypothetical protein
MGAKHKPTEPYQTSPCDDHAIGLNLSALEPRVRGVAQIDGYAGPSVGWPGR